MFLAKILETIARYSMIAAGETVVVGVSGGADSVALFHALWALRRELQIDLVAAHLNHGIRGEDADRDTEFVRQLATRLGVPSVVEKVDLPALSREMRLGMEEAAREVRYRFLERTASDANAARIAVAHSADDQAETILLNIIRGTGPDGISGMPPVRGKIIRPLIDLARSDVETYLRENDIEWRTDLTNLQLDYTRNRVRLELIPYLEQSFNPQIRNALRSLASIVRDESELVATAAREAFERVTKEAGPHLVIFDAGRMDGLPTALKRRCLRMAIETVKGDLRDVEFGQVDRLLAMLSEREPFTLTLPSGRVYAKLSDGELRVFRKPEIRKVELDRPIEIPGRTEVPELDIVIETRFVTPSVRPELPSQAVIDLEKTSGALRVRSWSVGDRMVPLGMSGSKKLQDIFSDRKIPRVDRGLVPVLVDDEKIVWVAGVVVSEEVKVTDSTRKALWVEIRDRHLAPST